MKTYQKKNNASDQSPERGEAMCENGFSRQGYIPEL